MARGKKQEVAQEKPQVTYSPYIPINMSGYTMAFESQKEAEEFLSHCTREGTLRTEGGKTTAINVLVYRKEKPEDA